MNVKKLFHDKVQVFVFKVALYSIVFFVMLLVGDLIFEVVWDGFHGESIQNSIKSYFASEFKFTRKVALAIIFGILYELVWLRVFLKKS